MSLAAVVLHSFWVSNFDNLVTLMVVVGSLL
mgnify:CR=1 FL=1